ncbi:methyltransferase family protein [Leptolinea tardivitalis]|uniref:S-isoprenylcysteine methyltransferase n=1 Tax=Leptolinea tardivitalis TaxID=229920 RepID=A0A0P6WQQ0_9CHLR|nr:isoprenylcysteine carboxylmethyltransferase family protein [Leptolinea tardivitalis]KPL71164.1 hypothetical protein ADM99_12995 [Leptolinea tardivitalis]GAP22607.1 putative protein-S-isoprenylcysteine methyltransferase [Leptolinea tardivitalis]
MQRSAVIKLALSRFVLVILILMAAFFLPAGTFNYWQAWVFMAALLIPLCIVAAYLIKNDPGLLERRMRTKETAKEQQVIVLVSSLFIILEFVLPGFDIRFGWSNVPVWMVLAADVLVLAAYFFILQVFRTNQYTSRVVEVEKGQSVISTGPYAIVRHPMYFGMVFMYVFAPLALGSFWAMIPGAMIIPTLIFRLLNEEKILEKELPGYKEYQQKVKYHLFPGIW